MRHFVYPILALALLALPSAALEPPKVRGAKLAPYVTSPQPVVDQMLKLAGLKTGEIGRASCRERVSY